MDLLNLIYLAVPGLTFCLVVLGYTIYRYYLRESSDIESILRQLSDYEKLWYFDKYGITLSITLIYLIGTTVFFIVKFYLNSPDDNCVEIYFPYHKIFCNPPQTIYGESFKGFLLGVLFALISYILIILIMNNFYRKIEFRIRSLNTKQKKELRQEMSKKPWLYTEAKKEFKELLDSILPPEE